MCCAPAAAAVTALPAERDAVPLGLQLEVLCCPGLDLSGRWR